MSDQNLPAVWDESLGTGFENEKDLGPRIPRVSIAQLTSHQLIPGDEKYLPDLKAGQWFADAGEKSKVLGGTFKFIALTSFDAMTKWKYKDATHKNQSFVAQLTVEQFDALGIIKDKSGKYTETTPEGDFVYNRSKNFVVLNANDLGAGIQLLSFKGMGFFPAIQMVNKFKSKVAGGTRLPMFAYQWALTTKGYQGDLGYYYGVGSEDKELLLTEVGPVTADQKAIVIAARKQAEAFVNGTPIVAEDAIPF